MHLNAITKGSLSYTTKYVLGNRKNYTVWYEVLKMLGLAYTRHDF